MDIEYLGPLDRRENYDPEVVRAALKYGIDPDLAVSVHRQEYSPDKWISSAGARGPMQLMPGTARELGVDPDDPQQNIDGGVRYLGQMLKAFGGDQVLALAAYNAGPGRVKAGTLPIETRRYTRDVIFRAKRLRQAAPEIEYLGPLEEEAPEIEYLGPLEDDLGPVGSNVVRKPIPEPGEEAPGTLRRAWEKFKELALPDDVGAAEIPAEAQARGVAAPTIDLSGARPMITVTPPEASATPFDEASLYRPMVRKPIPLGQGMGAASAEDEPEIEYLGPLEEEGAGLQEEPQEKLAPALEMLMAGMKPEDIEAEQKGLEAPSAFADPPNFIADVLSGFVTAPGRMAAGAIASGSVKAGSKALGKEIAEQAITGGLGSSFLTAMEGAGAEPLIQELSGILGPLATTALMQMPRSAIATYFKQLETGNPQIFERLKVGLEGLKDNPMAQVLLNEWGSVRIPGKIVSGNKTFIKGKLSGKIQRIRDYVTIDPLPAMTRHAPRAADAAVEHAAARIAVPHMVKDLLAKVFPDLYRDPKAMARTIDILNKDNVLAGWDVFQANAVSSYTEASKIWDKMGSSGKTTTQAYLDELVGASRKIRKDLIEAARSDEEAVKIAQLKRSGIDPASVKDYMLNLNKKIPGIVRRGGIPFDVLARDNGFESADALYEWLTTRKTIQQKLSEVPSLMDIAERFADEGGYSGAFDFVETSKILRALNEKKRKLTIEASRKVLEGKRWEEAMEDLSRQHDIDAYDREVKAAARDPEIRGNINRWKQHVNPLLDQLYNEAKRVDPGTVREERGRHFGARINLTTKERAAELADILGNRGYQLRPLPGPSIGSNYRNPNVKYDRFMRQAKFTGDYSTDAELALFNVLGPRWNEVTKIRMFEGLKKSGVAVETDPGMSGPGKIQGEDVTRLAVKLPMTGTDGRTRQVERALWVRKDLAREVRQVLGTDMPMEQNPVARVLTQIQLAQIADAVTHSKNLLTVVTRAQGAGSVWKDIVRRMPVFGTTDAVVRIGQVAREVMSDSPAIREEIANLAKLGVIRPDYPSTGLQKITRAQDFLHKLDQGTRIVMNRFFDNLVERGLVVDTPKNRRDYINQCGQYNGRLQGQLMNAFKQSGMSPFIVAGRNFNRQGIRGITGNPGIQATTAQAALEMRAINWLGTALTLSAVPMMLNTLTTGSPAGRSGTPLGAWDLGTEENEKGKHRVIDLAQISGLRRGMRVTGADAVVAGMKAGHTSNQIAGKILEDVTRNVMHPWIGPAPSGALKALTGRQLDIRGYMEAHKVPEGGGLQVLENVRAALESQNPLVYSMVRPVFEAAGLERLPEKPYGENIVATFLKSPYGAFGVKDVYPERSAALEMASTMMSGRMPEGTTPEQREKMRVKEEFGRAVRTGKPVDEELRERAKRLLSTTDLKTMGKRLQFDELQNKVKSLTSEEALKVFEVATSEERAGIVAIVVAKLARGLKNASPVERERLLEQLKRVRKRVFEASKKRP